MNNPRRLWSRPDFANASGLIVLALPFSTLAGTPREIAAKVLPAVVAITVFDSNGLPKAEGSGFFVEKDLIVTNYHVMK